MSDEAITVEQFCRRYVEPMGEESDHVHIVALTDALQAKTLTLTYPMHCPLPGPGLFARAAAARVAGRAGIGVSCLRCCDAVRTGMCSPSAACAARHQGAGAGAVLSLKPAGPGGDFSYQCARCTRTGGSRWARAAAGRAVVTQKQYGRVDARLAPQVPTRVVYLDRTAMPGEGGSSAVATYDFAPEACAGATPRVHLLYRPGHYDVLYLAPPAPAASA
jgi:hypothetical protein